MYRAILFDLDDTLYPYSRFVLGGLRNAARYAAKHLGMEEKTFFCACRQEWLFQGNSGRIFDSVLASLGLPLTAVPYLVQAFRNQDKLRLYPDAKEFLDAMRGKAALGVITDGLAWVQKRKIEALDANRYFQTIVYSDDYGRDNWKPSIIPYLMAWQRLGFPTPKSVVYIGDNPYRDFTGAKRLGFYTLRLVRGQYRSVRVHEAQDAHDVFSSFREVFGKLKLSPVN
ncbi:MAG: HAD-IA family hydrolase [Bacillota bacterium]